LYASPNIWLTIKVNRFPNFFKHGRGRIRAELETIAFSCLRVEIFDCVIQSAGGANYWHGAVTHAVHLIQAAWFVKRRHQENVSAGSDLMSERLAGVTFVNTYLMRRGVMQTL